jgi:ribose-phosphate pyrophosphokinase
VRVHLPGVDVGGRRVVLVDDLASTGQTLAEAAVALLGAGARRVDVAVTHALFSGGAMTTLRAAGAQSIWSSDSVAHESNVIPLAPMLARALGARRVRRSGDEG